MPYRDASGLAAERAKAIGLEFVGPYLGVMVKTTYRCETHGEFLQTPNKVQQRLGCQKCGRIQQGVTRKLTPERLEEDAGKVGLTFVGGFVTTQVDADFIGYGLTKDHETRHAAHMATFRSANISGELIATFDLASGREAADLELHLRAVLKSAHVTTGLQGFKTEAVAVEAEHEVLSTIAEWLSADKAEVRSAA